MGNWLLCVFYSPAAQVLFGIFVVELVTEAVKLPSQHRYIQGLTLWNL